jgi:hypothetical protein
MSLNYMSNPTLVLDEYLRSKGIRKTFEYGQLAMALELVSLIKTVESIPVVTDVGRQELITALHTLLQEKGMDQAYEIYDALCRWRRPRFMGIHVEPDERVPPGIAVVVGPDDQDPSSSRASLREATSPLDNFAASPEEHRDPGGDPTSS